MKQKLFKQVAAFLSLGAIIGIAAACESAGVVCPSEIVNKEPILSVSVSDSADPGKPVSEFVIKDVLIDGHTTSFDYLFQVDGSRGRMSGDSIICTNNCAFGNIDGVYSFTILSDGFLPKAVSIKPKHTKIRNRGCRTERSGPTKLNVVLSKLG